MPKNLTRFDTSSAIEVNQHPDVPVPDPIVAPIIQAASERKRGLLARLFPDQLQREFARHEKMLAEINNHSLEQVFYHFAQSKQKVMEEIYRDATERCQGRIRIEKADYLLSLFHQSCHRLNSESSIFARMISKELEHLSEIPIAWIRAKEERRLASMFEKFQQCIEDLTEDFAKIMEKGTSS